MKQQESHFFARGNSQHLLTGVSETAIIADKVLRLLSVVPEPEKPGSSLHEILSLHNTLFDRISHHLYPIT